MKFDQAYANRLKENPRLRKEAHARRNDAALQTGITALRLRLDAGLTQELMAELSGMTQPAVARAESSGCSLATLHRMAGAVGKTIRIGIGDSESLQDTRKNKS